jgi:hypothetical protein
MMTAIAGYAGSAKIGINTILELDKWDISLDADVYDTSSFTNAWHSVITGLKKWTGTCSGRQYQGDTTGQALLQAGLIAGTSVALALYTDAVHNYAGTAFVKQQQTKTAVNSTVDASWSFEGNGAIVYT